MMWRDLSYCGGLFNVLETHTPTFESIWQAMASFRVPGGQRFHARSMMLLVKGSCAGLVSHASTSCVLNQDYEFVDPGFEKAQGCGYRGMHQGDHDIDEGIDISCRFVTSDTGIAAPVRELSVSNGKSDIVSLAFPFSEICCSIKPIRDSPCTTQPPSPE